MILLLQILRILLYNNVVKHNLLTRLHCHITVAPVIVSELLNTGSVMSRTGRSSILWIRIFINTHMRTSSISPIQTIQSPAEYPVHIHDLYEIYYFLSGDVTYFIEGQSYTLSKHDLLVINTGRDCKPVFNSSSLMNGSRSTSDLNTYLHSSRRTTTCSIALNDENLVITTDSTELKLLRIRSTSTSAV